MNAVLLNTPVPLTTLRGLALFEGLDDEQCRQIADAARHFECAPGEFIVRQGETEQDLWVILQGQCEVVRTNEPENAAAAPVVLATLHAGETLGEMSFFQPAPHSASVRAKTAAKLLRIPRREFDELINNGSCAAYKLSVNIINALSARLRQMDQWVTKLLTQNGTQRQVAEWSSFRDKLFQQ